MAFTVDVKQFVNMVENYSTNQLTLFWKWFSLHQWLATGQWFSVGTPVSPTNKTDRHDITEILLKVALNTINQTTTGVPTENHWPVASHWCILSHNVRKLWLEYKVLIYTYNIQLNIARTCWKYRVVGKGHFWKS
jgi:hypothetical protein